MNDYDKIPNAAKAYVVVGILMKTIIDQIENPSLKAGILRNGCSNAIAGFRLKVGDGSNARIGQDVKDIWKNISDNGRIRFDTDNPDYMLGLFCQLLDPKDFKKFFLIPIFKIPMCEDDELIDKFSVYALRLQEELTSRYKHPRPKSQLVLKKAKKVKESKAMIKLRKEKKKKDAARKRELAALNRSRFNREVKNRRADLMDKYRHLIKHNSKVDLAILFDRMGVIPTNDITLELARNGNVNMLSVFINEHTASVMVRAITDIVNDDETAIETMNYLSSFVDIQ